MYFFPALLCVWWWLKQELVPAVSTGPSKAHGTGVEMAGWAEETVSLNQVLP